MPTILLAAAISPIVFLPKKSAKAGTATIFPYIKTAGPGTDLNSADQQWAAKHWDLTSTRKGQQTVYKTLNPNMKVLAYNTLSFFDTTAISNRNWPDWLTYANRNNFDPEIGLIHYKKDVPVTIQKYGPREDKFSAVYVNPQPGASNTNYYCKAYGDSSSNICPWGGPAAGALTLAAQAGQANYFAMETRFKEINFNITTPASGGWQAKWQYWNGTGWSDVTPSSDTTNGLTASGKIEFMPPPTESQWKKSSSQNQSISSDTLPLYWMRQIVTVSGNAPVVTSTDNRPPTPVGQKGIWSQNYLTGADTGYTFNFPGWDPANDTNGDGVWDTNNNPNATATFKWQARAPIWAFFPAQWVANPGDGTYRSWIVNWNK